MIGRDKEIERRGETVTGRVGDAVLKRWGRVEMGR